VLQPVRSIDVSLYDTTGAGNPAQAMGLKTGIDVHRADRAAPAHLRGAAGRGPVRPRA